MDKPTLPHLLYGSSTGTNMVQIVRMRRDIRIEQPSPITSRIVRPRADYHIIHGIVRRLRRPRRQPVLHIGVCVAQRVGRQTRYGILDMRDAVLVASLPRDERGECLVADPRRAEGVELAGAVILLAPAIVGGRLVVWNWVIVVGRQRLLDARGALTTRSRRWRQLLQASAR